MWKLWNVFSIVHNSVIKGFRVYLSWHLHFKDRCPLMLLCQVKPMKWKLKKTEVSLPYIRRARRKGGKSALKKVNLLRRTSLDPWKMKIETAPHIRVMEGIGDLNGLREKTFLKFMTVLIRKDSESDVEKQNLKMEKMRVFFFFFCNPFSLLCSILVSGWFHVMKVLVNHINGFNIILNHHLLTPYNDLT